KSPDPSASSGQATGHPSLAHNSNVCHCVPPATGRKTRLILARPELADHPLRERLPGSGARAGGPPFLVVELVTTTSEGAPSFPGIGKGGNLGRRGLWSPPFDHRERWGTPQLW